MPLARRPYPGLPACPDSSHPGSRIRRHGSYGQRVKGAHPHVHSRPRFRCLPKVGKTHTFSSGHTIPLSGPCDRCERPFGLRDGPSTPRRFMHIVPDIARALYLVGSGSTYTTAGVRTRELSGVHRYDETRKRWPEWGGRDWGLVADWVELFAHVAAGPDLIDEWPAKGAIICDTLPFAKGMIASAQPGTQAANPGHVSWSILVAMAPIGPHRDYRVARLLAVPQKPNIEDWERLYRSAAGRPKFVLSDGETQIKTAAENVWSDPTIVHRLAWDKLHLTLQNLLKNAGLGGTELYEAVGRWNEKKGQLPSIFRGYNEWITWCTLAHSKKWQKVPAVRNRVNKWITKNRTVIDEQFIVMPYFPSEASPVEVATTHATTPSASTRTSPARSRAWCADTSCIRASGSTVRCPRGTPRATRNPSVQPLLSDISGCVCAKGRDA